MVSIYKITSIVSIFLFISSIGLNAQSSISCGQQELMTKWLKDHPDMKQKYEQSAVKLKESIKLKEHQLLDDPRSPIIRIPVVFHILHLGGPENISDAQIHDQIRILNRDYQKQNSDTANVVTEFKNNIANVGFEFVLASIDPEGNCTNGIIRHYTSKTIWNADRLEDFDFTWPADRYLNFYIVKSINIAPAYTFLPGIGIPDSADAIVCESWLVGSIGTATVANSRVLTHEVGHWFGLPHIWGVSNAPGVACGDDFVDDTPITKGFVSCTNPNTKICDPNISENFQNYMDYTPCKLMFTTGQSNYMHETIEMGINHRDNLVSETNQRSTGILGQESCKMKVDFLASHTSICKDETIRFVNQSLPGNEQVTLAWHIKGGVPNESTDNEIEVRFPDTGTYEVILKVIGSNGVDSISKFVKVLDGNHGIIAPLKYSFDDGLLPIDFTVYSHMQTGIQWEILTQFGAENTKACMSIQHAKGSYPDQRSYFETPFFDLSQNSKPSMSFYYAYAKRTATQADSFRMDYTLDCGKSWKTFQGIHNIHIMANNTGGVSTSAFFPQSAQQWRKINLTSSFQAIFKNQPSVKFRFLFKSDPNAHGSNNFFIDEININDESITSVDNQEEKNILIYPNPSSSDVFIEIDSEDSKSYEVEISNFTNKLIEKIKPEYYANGKLKFIIHQNDQISAGIYFVKIKKSGQTALTRKIVLLK